MFEIGTFDFFIQTRTTYTVNEECWRLMEISDS